ncbi:hypothetical protein DGMP_24510 [Desulfomarina profundi]|uniref:Hemerythrin-like domain-containing protein n=2 Tax=Desulfomarina profundi TaxID=2772557 RepID=A0A8D5JDY1_9BACT|nr:hypothetical protein DGMP_24510 [Desulfomarina profundi]
MFGFFKRNKEVTVGGRKNRFPVSSSVKTDIEEKIYVKGTRISWHNDLIEEFKDEHVMLISLFSSIVAALDRGDCSSVRLYLKEFKRELISHILRENVLLYVYLKYLYIDDRNKRDLARKMQKEMTAIGNMVFVFISKATAEGAVYDDDFRKELEAVGEQLTRRIQVEEEGLYNLYTHPESVH